ncbi:cell envelope integrity protein TolA [Devosia sp.]|uniref:cell envelope integrity protein TolA n=1 Tax=Devosia sp. TaxID=1871048 RepID=UPI002FCAEAA7
MQWALPGSALVHAAVIGLALVGFAWPEPDDAPAAEAVSVSIVTLSNVSANVTQLVQSHSTVNMVSSGSAASAPPMEPLAADMVEPITMSVVPVLPEMQQPVREEPVEPRQVEAVEPIEREAPELAPTKPTIAVAELNSASVGALTSQATAPALEPVSSAELKTAPVPQTLSFERPSQPTYPKPAPVQTQSKPRAPAPQPSQSGNGGTNNADAIASAGGTAQQAGAGNGGDAEVARYPSEVLGRLRRALGSNSTSRGEVVVRFTVLANGQVSGISIGRSSGNAAVDQAGLATVTRAAPFPPIPAQANRSNWTFDVPLAFGV